MKCKDGVNITGIRTELLFGLMVCETVCQEVGVELFITSLNDSRHSLTSLHYAGAAWDMRTTTFNVMTETQAQQVVDRLKIALPDDYDVVLESNHIHVEWQPRRRS